MVTLLCTCASVSQIPKFQGLVTVRIIALSILLSDTDVSQAFILYRQHHQANVVAQNPGLANPEISKIIGEQWQNQVPEEKSRWKALAEEEKLRHQQQYPTYRYQPKRNGRRNSLSSDQPGSAGEKPKCQKCGGRTILTPSTPFLSGSGQSVPPTPGQSLTPVTRTLPILRDLSLQSPAARRMGRPYTTNMSPHYSNHPDERDDLGPLSPDNKRRKFNGEHGVTVNRSMPPRYGAAPHGPAVGPGTPFPFGQVPPPHPYPHAVAHARRESLPGLRGMVNAPGQMAPPPRPGIGYQQHRLSQGHIAPDRSLTLPPLQTGHQGGLSATAATGKTAEEQIMNIDLRYKIKVLSQVAPPEPKKKDSPRGPLIAVEGDSADAAEELAAWLRDMLNSSDDLAGKLFNGPELSANGSKEEIMAQYHRLASEWLGRSKDILESIRMKVMEKLPADTAMPDAVPSNSPQSARKIDENYDDTDEDSTKEDDVQKPKDGDKDISQRSDSDAVENMDVDKKQRNAASSSVNGAARTTSTKPVSIIANYSLQTSNVFACLIPLDKDDPYSPNDHWQWTATQWRGIVGPDLTIYVRDAVGGQSGRPPLEIETVDGRPDVGLFIVRRTKSEAQEGAKDAKYGNEQVEASVLRRVGFEVSEWVRAFGAKDSQA